MIVDTHVHIWEVPPFAPVGPTRPDQGGGPKVAGTAELLLEDMDANGVDWTVIVQTSTSTWDNGYIAESAAKYPARLIPHGLVDPLDPDNTSIASRWMDDYGMRGFRFHPMYYDVDDPAEGKILTKPETQDMLAAIEKRGGIVQIHCWAHHADQMDVAAARFPGIMWLIDHMMYPYPKWAADDWASYNQVLNLARHPNVFMKISDVHNRSEEDYPHRDMHPLVKRAIGTFGVERCLWGTGYPGHFRVGANWPPLDGELRIIREGLDWLSDSDVSAILGDNAARIWGLS